jgi:hypothetical protein
MPVPYDRHAKSKWTWGTEPKRSQQRAAAAADGDGSKRAPSKKNPDACKQNHWGPHELILVYAPTYFARNRQSCAWNPGWNSDGYRPFWWCGHEEQCKHCGKVIFRRISPEECPNYRPDIPEGVWQTCREADERMTSRKWMQKKSPITGPQGYRKKKSK